MFPFICVVLAAVCSVNIVAIDLLGSGIRPAEHDIAEITASLKYRRPQLRSRRRSGEHALVCLRLIKHIDVLSSVDRHAALDFVDSVYVSAVCGRCLRIRDVFVEAALVGFDRGELRTSRSPAHQAELCRVVVLIVCKELDLRRAAAYDAVSDLRLIECDVVGSAFCRHLDDDLIGICIFVIAVRPGYPVFVSRVVRYSPVDPFRLCAHVDVVHLSPLRKYSKTFIASVVHAVRQSLSLDPDIAEVIISVTMHSGKEHTFTCPGFI